MRDLRPALLLRAVAKVAGGARFGELRGVLSSERTSAIVAWEQIADWNLKRLRQIRDDPQCRVSFATLDTANVRPVAARTVPELFLCPPSRFTEHPHPTPESLLDRHGRRVAIGKLIGLETMSIIGSGPPASRTNREFQIRLLATTAH